YQVQFAYASSTPSCPIASDEQAPELAALWANNNCQRLLDKGNTAGAAELAVKYGLVTAVTGATVLEQKSDYQRFGLTEDASKLSQQNTGTSYAVDQGPQMMGAISGTIGPQAGDATVVAGINTAGTVRVNNLANLEALLNIIANSGEILGIVIGLFHIICGVLANPMRFALPGIPIKLTPAGRIVFGLGVVLIGLAIPGCINWLVASARDGN